MSFAIRKGMRDGQRGRRMLTDTEVARFLRRAGRPVYVDDLCNYRAAFLVSERDRISRDAAKQAGSVSPIELA